MVYMQRYQIYLDPHDVDKTDEIARFLDMSRSQIIRDVVGRVVREYYKLIQASAPTTTKNHPLLKMIGMGRTSAKNVSLNVDEIYLRD